ncbi:MAG TPA: Npt1/Npt2 family nucleotide transporter [Myxococcales bacterium LLY-WYZ-16_1]|nr:Npt1/Npt2 family nucleotide transporter [Myxococcales bacterium LLY-WYZ-16_1]
MAGAKKTQSPLRAIMDIRKEEWPLAALMSAYFFLVITTFWILKPIKKEIFIEFYDAEPFLGSWSGAEAEQLAKVVNMIIAAGAVVVFSALSDRLRRQQLTYVFSSFFIVCFAFFSTTISRQNDALAWSFYFLGDLWTTIMLATFFAFLNDSVKPEAARRLYGLVVFGGVAGGAFGANAVRSLASAVSHQTWLYITIGITAVIMAIAWAAARSLGRFMDSAAHDEASVEEPQGAELSPPERGDHPAIAGAKLVFSSKYLLSIVGIVALYEISSTILDFQFTAAVETHLDGDAVGMQIKTTYAITTILSLVVQLLFTSFVMTRFRLTVALLITPVAFITGSSIFLVLPLAWPGSFLSIADNGLNYSINQSAREALYTPTSREEKYKAKAFIDMFVQRAAKALAVVVNLVVAALVVGAKEDGEVSIGALRALSGIALLVVGLWAYAAWYAGRSFHRRTDPDPAADTART